MRRPVALVAGAYAAGIVFAYLNENIVCIAAAAIFISAAILFIYIYFIRLRRDKIRAGSILLAGIFLMSWGTGIFSLTWERERADSLEASAGTVQTVIGTVAAAEEKERGEKYRLKVKRENGSAVLITVIGNVADMEGGRALGYRDLIGRKMEVRSEIMLPMERRNPGTFDYRLFLRSEGIRTVMSVKAGQIKIGEIEEGYLPNVFNGLSVFKGNMEKKLEKTIGKERTALIQGMLFGETDMMDEEIYETFQRNGTAHILSVSGLHVGLVYMCISGILGGRRNPAAHIMAILLLLMYGAMASFAPPVVRAIIMIIMHIAAKLFYLRYDLLCAASFAALGSLIFNPYMLFNTGFQLSYLAIISMAFIMNGIKKYYQGIFLSAIAVQIGMAPATAYLFNYFSLSSIIANIPVIFISGLIIPAGMLLMVISPFDTFVFEIMAGTLGIICDMMVFCNDFTYGNGKFSSDVTSPGVFFIVLYYFLIFGGISERGIISYKRKEFKKIAVFIAVALGLSAAAQLMTDDGFSKADMVFVDVGQGDCLHIKTEEGNSFLIDGGGSENYDVGENTLKPYLLKNGVRRVSIAFVTHLHTDHYKGIASLCRAGMVEKLCLYDGNRLIEDEILSETGLKKEQLIYAKRGDKIKIGEGKVISILSPEAGTEEEYRKMIEEGNENDNSLIMRLEYEELSVLMTGDIDKEGELKLLSQSDVSCNVLKAAHHGSKYSSSSEFMEAAAPKVMVFQVGKNNYGHPHKPLVEECIDRGIAVYRNDIHGAIGLCSAGQGRWRIITVIGE